MLMCLDSSTKLLMEWNQTDTTKHLWDQLTAFTESQNGWCWKRPLETILSNLLVKLKITFASSLQGNLEFT